MLKTNSDIVVAFSSKNIHIDFFSQNIPLVEDVDQRQGGGPGGGGVHQEPGDDRAHLSGRPRAQGPRALRRAPGVPHPARVFRVRGGAQSQNGRAQVTGGHCRQHLIF